MWIIRVFIGSRWHVLTGAWEHIDACEQWAQDHVPASLVYEIAPTRLH